MPQPPAQSGTTLSAISTQVAAISTRAALLCHESWCRAASGDSAQQRGRRRGTVLQIFAITVVAWLAFTAGTLYGRSSVPATAPAQDSYFVKGVTLQRPTEHDTHELSAQPGAVGCQSGMRNDLTFTSCASWCKASKTDEHCPWCKCRDCPFCRVRSMAAKGLRSAVPGPPCSPEPASPSAGPLRLRA